MDQVKSPFVLLDSNTTSQASKSASQPSDSAKSSKTSKVKKQSKKQKPLRPMARALPPKAPSKSNSPPIDQFATLSMDQFPPLLTPPVEQALQPMESDAGIKPIFYPYPPPSFSSSNQPSPSSQELSPSNQSEIHPLPAYKSQPLALPKPEIPTIQPCTDYQTHAAWLSKYFPAEMNKKGRYFVQIVLQIKSYRAMTKYLGYTAEEWRFTLGDEKYAKYYDCIADLIIIWSLTMDRTDPIPYSEYYESKQSLYDTLIETYQAILPHKHKEPVNPDDLKPPPVYSRFSPVDKRSQEKSNFSVSKSVSLSKKSRKHHRKDSKTTPNPTKSIPSYHTTMPSQIDSRGQHVVTSMSKSSDDSDSSSSNSSLSTKHTKSTKQSRRSKRSKRSDKSTRSEMEAENGWIPGMDIYGNMDPKDLVVDLKPKSFSMRIKDSDSVIQDRVLQSKPAKFRAKFDTKWDGLCSSFNVFKRALEGHLLQVGAGYMTQPSFIDHYKELKTDYLKSDVFWNLYKVSFPQALADRQYLYGVLVTATMSIQHKTIIKHQTSLDGILAWYELKSESEYNGFKELRLE